MSKTTSELPESVTSIFESIPYTKCRVVWQSLLVTAEFSNDWQDIKHEMLFKELVERFNAQHKNEMYFWIEYK